MLHFMLRRFRDFSMVGLGLMALASGARAGVLVNDTWKDGTDSDPGFVTYAEPGTDTDLDGDIESTWFQGGVGTLNPVTMNGPLQAITYDATLARPGTGSSNATTYFKPAGQKVVLAAEGDALKITWKFKLVGVNAGNTSQNFRFAVVDSGARIAAANGSPPNTTYAGYAILGNMGTTLGSGGSFQLRERTLLLAGNLLVSQGDFGGTFGTPGNGAVSGLNGYAADTEYTMTWLMTRAAADSLDLNISMSGGTLGDGGGSDDGKIEVLINDPTPNTFQYDTFNIRPSGEASTASEFLTSSFKAEFLPAGGEVVLNANFNGDAQVDGDDLLIWQRNLGATGQTSNVNGDANGNGTVGAEDLQVWRDHFGQATAIATPEPASMATAVLALLGAAPLVRRRRGR